MQCGPVRFFLSPKKAAKFSQLQHKVIPRLTKFLWNGSENQNTIHEIYAALIADAPRNDMIVNDVRQALLDERSPLLLTSRTEHLDYLAGPDLRIMPARLCVERWYGNEAKKTNRGVDIGRPTR